MVTNINKTTTVKGLSGKEYKFVLYTFDTFSDVQTNLWLSEPALYLFTHREYSNGAYYHTYLYLGETGDLSQRFANHHKEEELKQRQTNCIGIYLDVPQNEADRKQVEKDILSAYKFPCNEQYQ